MRQSKRLQITTGSDYGYQWWVDFKSDGTRQLHQEQNLTAIRPQRLSKNDGKAGIIMREPILSSIPIRWCSYSHRVCQYWSIRPRFDHSGLQWFYHFVNGCLSLWSLRDHDCSETSKAADWSDWNNSCCLRWCCVLLAKEQEHFGREFRCGSRRVSNGGHSGLHSPFSDQESDSFEDGWRALWFCHSMYVYHDDDEFL